MMVRALVCRLRVTILLACIAFTTAFAVASISRAVAHEPVIYIPKTWSSDPGYSLGSLDAPLNTTAAKNSLRYGASPWNSISGSWLDFRWTGTEDSSVTWDDGACATAPSNGVWIITYDEPDGFASEATCVQGDTIIKSVIVIDNNGPTWFTGSSATVPSGSYDLRSAAVHEFGHSVGFRYHFTSINTDCEGSDMHTMCAGLPSGTSYKRSLESHDAHTVKDAY